MVFHQGFQVHNLRLNHRVDQRLDLLEVQHISLQISPVDNQVTRQQGTLLLNLRINLLINQVCSLQDNPHEHQHVPRQGIQPLNHLFNPLVTHRVSHQ